jgi:hypothetical protein
MILNKQYVLDVLMIIIYLLKIYVLKELINQTFNCV